MISLAGERLAFGSDPRIGIDASWTFAAVGVKQLVLMSDMQLIGATPPRDRGGPALKSRAGAALEGAACRCHA